MFRLAVGPLERDIRAVEKQVNNHIPTQIQGLNKKIDDLRDDVYKKIDDTNKKIDDFREYVKSTNASTNKRIDDVKEYVQEIRTDAKERDRKIDAMHSDISEIKVLLLKNT